MERYPTPKPQYPPKRRVLHLCFTRRIHHIGGLLLDWLHASCRSIAHLVDYATDVHPHHYVYLGVAEKLCPPQRNRFEAHHTNVVFRFHPKCCSARTRCVLGNDFHLLGFRCLQPERHHVDGVQRAVCQDPRIPSQCFLHSASSQFVLLLQIHQLHHPKPAETLFRAKRPFNRWHPKPDDEERSAIGGLGSLASHQFAHSSRWQHVAYGDFWRSLNWCGIRHEGHSGEHLLRRFTHGWPHQDWRLYHLRWYTRPRELHQLHVNYARSHRWFGDCFHQ